MSPHWESSDRPLFIRTVWKDGQRHVLLKKEKPTAETLRHSSPRSSTKSPRTSTSATITNMRVSSFKIFKGFEKFGRSDQLVTCKTNSDQPRIRTVDKTCSTATLVKRYQTAASIKKLSLSIKSNSIDLTEARHRGREYNEDAKCIQCSPLGLNNPESNVLSQRVLVWLDLALQNNDVDKNMKPLIDKLHCKRYGTPQKKTKMSKNPKSAPVYLKEKFTSFDELSDTFHIGPVPELMKKVESRFFENNSSSDNSNNSGSSINTDEQPIISSTVENDIEIPIISDEVVSDKIMTAKRQLHIFMPGLQNKRDDCESSILSSTLSAYSSHKCPMFCS